MKTITRIFAALLFVSTLHAQSSECTRTVGFGDVEICLPQLEGMQECYEYPAVKVLADATEAPMNEVLGYYLTGDTYEERDRLTEVVFDDYLKFYGTTQVSTYPIPRSELGTMQEMVGDQFSGAIQEMSQKVVEQSFENLEIGKPELLDNYKINDDSFTLIAVVVYSIGEIKSTMIMSINGMILADRLVWMAYYLDYDGEESVKAIKAKTKVIVDATMAVN